MIKERDDAAVAELKRKWPIGKAQRQTPLPTGAFITREHKEKTALPRGGKKVALPKFVPPQLATLVDAVPAGEDWLHEIKFDGYRLLCRIHNRRAIFLTREGHDWTKRFNFLTEAALSLPVRDGLLDGEVVALRADGATDFQLLQNS